MDTPLLQTKLYIPQPQPNLVPRPRLIERLNEGVSRKLTLIAAPAGFGKTTLVSDWLRQLDLSIAWLALDEGDSEVSRFLTYTIAALQKIDSGLGQTSLSLLQLSEMPATENVITLLINEIATFTDKIILILDDYHAIQNLEVHKALAFLLDRLPPQLHLIILSRTDPPFPLSRLRVRQQMTEIRHSDLRFTEAEAAAFLNELMNLQLLLEDVAALEARTEGWIAGLQLAALSLRGRADKREFVSSFAGSHRQIIDYLSEDVLQLQNEAVQHFLLQTAILDRLSGPLCDAVTGQTNSQMMLENLERANLFIIPLDNERHWYRYHHLFADFLRIQLRYRQAGQISELHRRANRWYQEQGFTDDAIHHALAGEDRDQAARLIESVGVSLIVEGRLRKLLGWLEALPDEYVQTRPLLSVCYAWVLNLMGQAAAVEPRLQDAGRGLSTAVPKQRQDIQGLIHTVRAFLARRQGDIPGSMQHLRQAAEDLSPDNLMARASVYLNLGFNYALMGQLTQAAQTLQAARRDGRASNAVYVTLLAMAVQANTCVAQGQLRRAIELYQEAIDYGLAQNKGRPFPPAGYAYAGLGQVMYEQNDLDSAERYLALAVELGELMAEWSMIRRGLLPLAWLKQMQGDSAAAQALWQQALSVVQQAESKRVEVQLETHRVRLWLVQARMSDNQSALSLAIDWADKYQQNPSAISSYPEAFAQITLAWVELVRGKTNQALIRLEALAQAATAGGQLDNLIKILVLQALAQAAQDDLASAVNTLSRALELAAPEGYVRTFVDHGPPMLQLLRQVAAQGNFPAYVAQLLAAFSDSAEEVPIVNRKSNIQNFVEPLNDRELSILRLMAAGLSNREIAEELYLSVNTVKWYSSHIYGKLGVKKRAEAVDRAHELGVL